MNLFKLNLIALGCVAALASGCAMRTKVLDVQAVSMTRPSLGPGETLRETGPVKGEFCADSMRDAKRGVAVGLMDEAVKRAQEEHKVDFITNATFYSSGSCMIVEGTGQRAAR